MMLVIKEKNIILYCSRNISKLDNINAVLK